MLQENLTKNEAVQTPYERLAEAIYTHLRTSILQKKIRTLRIEKNPPVIRTAIVFQMLYTNGFSLNSASEILLKPRDIKFSLSEISKDQIATHFVGPLLAELRDEDTILNYCKKIGVKNSVTYHYWEKGSRDIPFATFLQIVDVITNRLQLFCETIYFKNDLREFGLNSFKPNFSEKFFGTPWVPTVYLALQTEAYTLLPTHSDLFLEDKLNIPIEQIRLAIKTLLDLEIINFDGRLYKTFDGMFYTPPTLDSHMLDDLNRFWLNQAYKFTNYDGLHKIEQASMSYESYDRIKFWVAELREKIRKEIQVTKPETIVHMQWQVLDLYSGSNKARA